MTVSNVIKSIQDIMRKDAGVDGDAQRISQLTWMIFLKIFDDKEQELEALDEDYKSPLPEKLRWQNWAADPEGITGDELLDFINNQLFKTLKNLNISPDKNPRGFLIKEVFEDAYNYMKSGTLIRQVINKLNEVNFNKTEDRHLFNEIYETILRDMQSAGNAGEYYTPRAVTQFIADIISPKLGEKVLDPACGTGGFLVSALEQMKKQVKSVDDKKMLEKNLIGIDKKPLPHLLCMTNLILHDVELPAVRHDNALARPLRDYTSADMVDVVMTNPPFGGAEEEGIALNFPQGYRTKETADLFLLLIMKILREGGRCGMVLPDGGVLSADGVERNIREKLLSEFNLHTIVRLPNGAFSPYTDIKTNLLFFEKGKPTTEIWYFEHPLPQGYKKYTKSKPIHISEFHLEQEWWNNRKDERFRQYSWKVSVDELKSKHFNLDIKNPNTLSEETSYSRAEMITLMEKSLQTNVESLGRIKKELGEEMNKFQKVKLKDVLKQYRITHLIQDDRKYRQVTISQTGEVSCRGEQFGSKIGRKRQFIVDLKNHPNTLIFIRQGVFKGGIGIAPQEVDGCIVTENMPMFDIVGVEPKYLRYYTKSPQFKRAVNSLVPIGTAQKAIHERQLLELDFPLPDTKTQLAILKKIEAVERLGSEVKQSQRNSELLLDAALKEAFEENTAP